MDLCFFTPGSPLIRSVPPPPVTLAFTVDRDLPIGTVATVILQPPTYFPGMAIPPAPPTHWD